ncbi:MFS transporter [Pseudomonas brassicacearum]|uniref:MFS transporter n=1 Tax=Pseudomonas brassicacearum TaxID=930166 RepID=UPI0005B49A77|nr:MFS transporter [Pseudomonas brassicacearum]
MLMQNLETEPVTEGLKSQANISARLERLPITRQVFWARNIIGAATFFDGYTVIAIAYAMPVLAKEWNLTATQIGMILSFGYLGQLLGAVFFGWLAERIGRMKVLTFTILLFVAMDVACLFAWSAGSMILFRFLQGIGTGGEVPVASAYVNELIGSKKRGKFFLLYEVMFLLGLVGAGIIGYLLVPIYGWKAMFAVGLVPATILIPLRFFLFESPRWLASKGRLQEADRIVTRLENSVLKAGKQLAPAVEVPQIARPGATQGWRELFHGMYFKRSMVIWAMWFGAYMVANGLITWLPTLYRQHFNLPLDTSLAYGFITSGAGVVAAVICALLIDRFGRRRWYMGALFLAAIPLSVLALTGATSPLQILLLAGLGYALVQTVTFSLYLYSAELYPTRLRALGTGLGSAWLRLGSATGPLVVGLTVTNAGAHYVFGIFAVILIITGCVTALFAVETKGRILEELSP